MLIEMHIPHDIEAVVLANGDYPFADVPFQLLKRAPYVVCCDGGANEYIESVSGYYYR